MFNLFRKKGPSIKVTDKIVIAEEAKLKAMLNYWTENKNAVFIFWFDESLDHAEKYFTAQTTETVTLLTARQANAAQLTGKIPVFAEHYPLRNKEEELYHKLGLTNVLIFSSLKEALFQRFGGDRIIEMMQKLGMKDDTLIEHALISNSIRQAQDKIEKKVVMEVSAHSQKDWLQKNLSA